MVALVDKIQDPVQVILGEPVAQVVEEVAPMAPVELGILLLLLLVKEIMVVPGQPVVLVQEEAAVPPELVVQDLDLRAVEEVLAQHQP